MTSLITCSIDYHLESVICFDPQKVLAKLLDAFPAANSDRTDLSAEEVAWIHEYTDSEVEMSKELQDIMRRQIAGKQRRNGPAFRFRLSDEITGHVSRYALVFSTETRFGADDSDRIRAFIRTLGAGTTSETELD